MSGAPDLIKGVLADGQIHKIDYNALANKPDIDGIETAINRKQDTLTFDSTPKSYSSNPVTSKGIKTALNLKQDTLTFDSTPRSNSTNPVTSKGIKSAIDQIASRIGMPTLYVDNISIAKSTIISSGGTKTISLPYALTIGKSVYNASYYSYESLKADSIYAPHVQIIGQAAFMGNDISGELNLPECRYIDRFAFNACNNITALSLPMCEHIEDGAFGYDYNAAYYSTDYKIEYAYLGNATYIGACAFASQTRLSSISFNHDSDGVLVPLTVGSQAFKNCLSLSKIYNLLSRMSRIEASTFQSTPISSIFAGFSSRPSPVSIIGSYAFLTCSSLSTIEGLENCETIETCAFGGCSRLLSANFPKCRIIGERAFSNCTDLSTITIPNCSTISSRAFQSTDLRTMNLPACLSIGSSAFLNCYKLSSLYLLGSKKVNLMSSDAFDSTPIGGYSDIISAYGTIYVPSSIYDSYISDNVWSHFSSRIVSM